MHYSMSRLCIFALLVVFASHGRSLSFKSIVSRLRPTAQKLNPFTNGMVSFDRNSNPIHKIFGKQQQQALVGLTSPGGSATTVALGNSRDSDSHGPIRRLIAALTKPVRDVYGFFEEELPMLFNIWPSDSLRLRIYLVLSLIFMFLGKWFNVKMPFILQRAIDTVSRSSGAGAASASAAAAAAIIFYGVSRALSVVCSEIKTCLFAHVSQNALRKFACNIFSHLHTLDSEFHLETPSGVVSVAYVRAVRGFQTMLFQLVFSVAPTLLELFMVSNILYKKCGPIFAGVTLATFSIYLAFTVWVTQWRIDIRKELVEVDNARNGFFIDSVLNHEVVKLFTNEKRETAKFNDYLTKIQDLSVESTYAIAVLNLGQAALFCAGLTASLLIALQRVGAGTMTVGDLVAVNSMLLQLSIPFNFMGFTYQELRQSFVDMGFMRNVLVNIKPSIVNDPTAPDIDLLAPRNGPSTIEFRNVSFRYGNATNSNAQDLLKSVSFKILPGQNVAIVGPSGSGKSTTLRLITRMLDPCGGQILLDGIDIRNASLDSLRKRVAVVPQDNSLFDDSIEFNIRYGNSSATATDLKSAMQRCNLDATIEKLRDGLQTQVGERGARLSGGERQKVSIARALLKDPTLILCDEVTSAVDAFAERDIVDTLRRASEQRTTLTVAHRLSSITHCDVIIVFEKGRIAEKGTHQELLRVSNGVYARMWNAQNGDHEKLQPEHVAAAVSTSTSTVTSVQQSLVVVGGGASSVAPPHYTSSSPPPGAAAGAAAYASVHTSSPSETAVFRRDGRFLDSSSASPSSLGTAGLITQGLQVYSVASAFNDKAVEEASAAANGGGGVSNSLAEYFDGAFGDDDTDYDVAMIVEVGEGENDAQRVDARTISEEPLLEILESVVASAEGGVVEEEQDGIISTCSSSASSEDVVVGGVGSRDNDDGVGGAKSLFALEPRGEEEGGPSSPLSSIVTIPTTDTVVVAAAAVPPSPSSSSSGSGISDDWSPTTLVNRRAFFLERHEGEE